MSVLTDLYPSPTVLLSLSKENSSYVGNCLTISRSDGTSSTNIGFTGNNLDTTSLNTFLGGGTAFIDKWFDQSGNGNDATQSTLAKRWQIIIDTDGLPSTVVPASTYN